MTKQLVDYKSRVLAIVMLIILPLLSITGLNEIISFKAEMQLTSMFWASYLILAILGVYTVITQYFIMKIIQSKWTVGIIVCCIILLIYFFIPFLANLNIGFLGNIITCMSQLQYKLVSIILLLFTVFYSLYYYKKES